MTLNHQRLADEYSGRLGRDIQLLAYEGGPHLNGNNASYQNVLFEATKDPRMADITRDYLRMQNAAGLDAYVHYKLTDRDRATQYGLFGVLLAQDQPTSEAHIYRRSWTPLPARCSRPRRRSSRSTSPMAPRTKRAWGPGRCA